MSQWTLRFPSESYRNPLLGLFSLGCRALSYKKLRIECRSVPHPDKYLPSASTGGPDKERPLLSNIRFPILIYHTVFRRHTGISCRGSWSRVTGIHGKGYATYAQEEQRSMTPARRLCHSTTPNHLCGALPAPNDKILA